MQEVQRVRELPEDDPDFDPDPDLPGPPVPDFYNFWRLAKEITQGDMFRLTQLPNEEPYIHWLMYFASVCIEARDEAQRLYDAHARANRK